jgi:hypothetical protein
VTHDDDAALWQAARTMLPGPQRERLEALHHKQQCEGLAAAEQEEEEALLALIDQIKAMPRDPANIIPGKGNLAEVLRALEAMEPAPDYDLDSEIAALDAAEAKLRAINQADDIAEGRG